MSIDASDFSRAGAKLASADKALKKAARKVIGREGRPIAKDALREGLNQGFPGHRGGLINYLAKSRVQVSPAGSEWAGVRVVMGSRKNHQIGRMVRSGVVRHPVFGNRKVWANTAIPNPGALLDAVNHRVDDFKKAAVTAMQQALDEAVK